MFKTDRNVEEIEEFSPVFNKKRKLRRPVRRKKLESEYWRNLKDTDLVPAETKESVDDVVFDSQTQSEKSRSEPPNIANVTFSDLPSICDSPPLDNLHGQFSFLQESNEKLFNQEVSDSETELTEKVPVEETNVTDFTFEFSPTNEEPYSETVSSPTELNQICNIATEEIQPHVRQNRVKKVGVVADVANILEKHKSSITLWYHQHKAPPKNVKDHLNLRVSAMKKEFDRILCFCNQMNDKNEQGEALVMGKKLHLVILFDSATVESSIIMINSRILVYPPYQQLISDQLSCPVVIGPKYFFVLNPTT